MMNTEKIQKVLDGIKGGDDIYFGVAHFHASNMADYTLMSSTISDMVQVYDLDESEAIEVIQALTHSTDKERQALKN